MGLFTSSRFVKQIASLSLVGFIFCVTSIALHAAPADACTDAQMRAKDASNGGLWFAVGCLTGPLGVVGSYVIKPDPPASAMLGKDATYVANYTDCYRESSVASQTKNAWWGCATLGVVLIAYNIYAYMAVIP